MGSFQGRSFLRPLVKGNEDSGFEVALVKTSFYHIMMTGNFKLKDVVAHTNNQVVALAAYFTSSNRSHPIVWEPIQKLPGDKNVISLISVISKY